MLQREEKNSLPYETFFSQCNVIATQWHLCENFAVFAT